MTPTRQTLFKLRATEETAVFIRALHPELKRKIKSALKRSLDDPDSGKSLRDALKGLKSFRVGRFRIIYRPAAKHVIEIVAIGPRKVIYELTYRIIKKTT